MIEYNRIVENIDWEELSQLYLIAPLGHKSPEQLRTVFSNSMFACFAFDAGRLVGAGRTLADGRDCAYICDMAVHPDYQGQGIGKTILMDLVARARGHKKIILYAAPGKEPFYRKFGFKPMTTAMAIFEDQAGALERGLVRDV